MPTVPIKVIKLPAVYAAVSAAFTFYCYPLIADSPHRTGILLLLFFIVSAPLAFLRVLIHGPFLFTMNTRPGGSEVPRSLKEAGLLAAAAAAGLCLGLSAGALIPPAPALGLPADRVTGLSGILVDDPRSFNDGRGMGAVTLNRAAGEGGLRTSATGKITVFFPAEVIPRLKEFGRGCEVFIEGKLVQSSGAYSGGTDDLLFRASAVYITKPASRIEQIRTSVRGKILDKLNPASADEAPVWGALASALLLGVRDNLDSDLAAGFRNSGCSHVLALSGMHLALLSGIIAFFLRRVLGLRMAALAGGLFIVVYVFAAGGQASLVRAAIMYLLGAVCLWGFLKRDALVLLCLAFIIQIFFQSDAGTSVSFILSYLALAGILTVGESVKELFRGRVPEIVGASLAASIGAFVVTAPVVSLYFGALRPVGIIAGLVIVPLASLFMIIVLAGLVLSSIVPLLFEPVNLVLTFLYRLIEFMVSLAGNVPGFLAPHSVIVLFAALAASGLLVFLQNLDSAKRRKIAPFII